MNINDFFHVPILSFPPQVSLSRLKFVHLLSVEIDCEQSLFFFRFSEGIAGALKCRGKKWGWQPEKKKRKKKKVSFWCLSCLTPSITQVVICVSHTFCLTDQEKERLLLQTAYFIWSWVRASSLTMHASATVVLWKATLKALLTLK